MMRLTVKNGAQQVTKMVNIAPRTFTALLSVLTELNAAMHFTSRLPARHKIDIPDVFLTARLVAWYWISLSSLRPRCVTHL